MPLTLSFSTFSNDRIPCQWIVVPRNLSANHPSRPLYTVLIFIEHEPSRPRQRWACLVDMFISSVPDFINGCLMRECNSKVLTKQFLNLKKQISKAQFMQIKNKFCALNFKNHFIFGLNFTSITNHFSKVQLVHVCHLFFELLGNPIVEKCSGLDGHQKCKIRSLH